MDYMTFKTSYSGNRIALYVYGDDEYLRVKAIEHAKDLAQIQNEEFNFVTYDCQSDFDIFTGIKDIVNTCNKLPFMSDKQMVVVKNFSIVVKNNESLKAKTVADEFAKYLSNPNEACLLIFDDVTPIKGLQTNINLLAVDCQKLNRAEIVKWIIATAKSKNKHIERKSAELISDYCLNNMTRVNVEVAKLCDYCEKTVSESDVELLVNKDLEYVIYDLTNSIANKDMIKAMSVLDRMLESKESIPALFSLIYGNYRRMFYVSTTNASDDELASYFNVKPFAITKAKQGANAFGAYKLSQAIKYCKKADEKIKQFDKQNEVLRLLILQLMEL